MTSAGSRALFGLSLVTLVAGGVAMAATPDRLAMALLFTAAVVAVLVGLGMIQAGGPADAAARAGLVSSTDAQAPSAAPIVAALAGGVAVLGLALGLVAYAAAILLALAAAFFWLSDTHRTSRLHVSRVSDRVSERLTLPIAIPVLATATLALLAISVSRILLASTKSGAVAVAGVVATIFLIGGCLAAARPRSTRQQFWAVTIVALLAVAGLGVAGVIKGETPIKHHGEKGHSDTGHSDTGHSDTGHSDKATEGHSDQGAAGSGEMGSDGHSTAEAPATTAAA